MLFASGPQKKEKSDEVSQSYTHASHAAGVRMKFIRSFPAAEAADRANMLFASKLVQ